MKFFIINSMFKHLYCLYLFCVFCFFPKYESFRDPQRHEDLIWLLFIISIRSTNMDTDAHMHYLDVSCANLSLLISQADILVHINKGRYSHWLQVFASNRSSENNLLEKNNASFPVSLPVLWNENPYIAKPHGWLPKRCEQESIQREEKSSDGNIRKKRWHFKQQHQLLNLHTNTRTVFAF